MLSAGAAKAITAASIAKQLWLHEGWKGLFAGTGARVMSIAPGCAISWLMYERIMQIL